MTMRRSIVRAAWGFAVWITLGVGVAHAGVIRPIDPATKLPVAGSPVTVSIFSTDGVDITDSWLPTWNPTTLGVQVFVVVNKPAPAVLGSVTLVAPPAPASIVFNGLTNPFLNATTLTTSAYPGQCTNFGSPTDLGADFTIGTVFEAVAGTGLTGVRLTAQDCGGMAVIQVVVDGVARTFILPKDENVNGVADIYEATSCPGNSCPTGREDNEATPGNPTVGDGLFALDEARGFIVSGKHVRTDQSRKDLFVRLVNPQCVPGNPLTSTASLLGGGTITYASGDALFGTLETLIGTTQIHRLGYAIPNATHLTTDEWVDRFHHYSVADGLRFGDGTVTVAPVDDRQINGNAVYFTVVGGSKVPQRGVRVIECLDTSSPSLLGFAPLGSPNGNANAIIFTQRIVNYFTSKLRATCATPTTPCLFFSTFRGAWTLPAPISPFDLFTRAFAFYFAHETAHSSGPLTPAVQGGKKTSYGNHHAPGTGSNMDQTLTTKVTAKGKTFYIPTQYNTSDLGNYKVK
jgi:hypothetical protein